MQKQIFARFRRLKNFNNIVYIFKYYIKSIICFEQIIRNLKKLIFETVANFNKKYIDVIKNIVLKN